MPCAAPRVRAALQRLTEAARRMKVLLCGDMDAAEARALAPGAGRGPARGDAGSTSTPRARRPAEVQAAVVANPPPGSLQGLPHLRLIQSLWAGVDRLLADATLPAGVPIARMVDPAMSAAMAETALWAVLSLHRDFFVYAQQQRAGRVAASMRSAAPTSCRCSCSARARWAARRRRAWRSRATA